MVAGLPSRFKRDRWTVGKKKKSLLAAASTAVAGGDKCGSEIPRMPQGQNKLRPDGVAFKNQHKQGRRVSGGHAAPLPCPSCFSGCFRPWGLQRDPWSGQRGASEAARAKHEWKRSRCYFLFVLSQRREY